jgi:hypothetical protein
VAFFVGTGWEVSAGNGVLLGLGVFVAIGSGVLVGTAGAEENIEQESTTLIAAASGQTDLSHFFAVGRRCVSFICPSWFGKMLDMK